MVVSLSLKIKDETGGAFPPPTYWLGKVGNVFYTKQVRVRRHTKTRPGAAYIMVPAEMLCDEFQETYLNPDLLQAIGRDRQSIS